MQLPRLSTFNHPTTFARSIAIAIGTTALALFPTSASATPDPGQTEVVTREAAHLSMSSDGQTVVYSALDESGGLNVMLVDGSGDGPTPLVTVGSGMRGGDTVMPVISGDGCVVVAISEIAFDLFRDDDRRSRWDVYRRVLPNCGGADGWELVSTDDEGIAVDVVSSAVRPAVSATGSTIAYTAINSEGRTSVRVVDLTKPITTPRTVSVPEPAGGPDKPYRYIGADQPALSGDGERLVFRADFDPTGERPEWNTGPVRGGDAAPQVYIWDLDEPDGFDLVSARDGEPATGGARQPTISADGSTVAFVANDPQLDPTVGWACDPRCPDQVFVSRRSGDWGSPLVASASVLAYPVENGPDGAGTTGDRRSWRPRLSDDGSQVAFLSRATDLTTRAPLKGSHPRSGDLLIVDVDPDPDPDEARAPAPPTPVDAAAPRAADHTGYAMSGSFATTVVDVGKVAGGRILGEASERTIVVMSAQADLTMASLDFGTVRDGLESDELFTSLRNNGPVGFTPKSVESDSDLFEVTGGSCTTMTVVPPGGACTVYATFTPSGEEGAVATLTITGVEGLQASTTMAGRAGDPGLRVEPDGVDFGSVPVGDTSESKTVTIENYGFDPMTINGIAVTGANKADVKITDDGCTGTAVEADGSCDVSLKFTPTASGNRWATLEVSSIDGPATTATIVGSGRRRPTIAVEANDDTGAVTVDGEGFPADTPVAVTIVGRHATYEAVTGSDGTFHLADVPSGPGPHITVAAVGDDRSLAFARVTVAVEPSTPTYLPGYGVG